VSSAKFMMKRAAAGGLSVEVERLLNELFRVMTTSVSINELLEVTVPAFQSISIALYIRNDEKRFVSSGVWCQISDDCIAIL
jgi:hypothetical protein